MKENMFLKRLLSIFNISFGIKTFKEVAEKELEADMQQLALEAKKEQFRSYERKIKKQKTLDSEDIELLSEIRYVIRELDKEIEKAKTVQNHYQEMRQDIKHSSLDQVQSNQGVKICMRK